MPLIPQIQLTEISVNDTPITIDNITGNYNASTNPGGWGAPNPNRADFALALYGFSYERNEDADTALVVSNVSGTDFDVEQWTIATLHDGYVYITMLVIPEYSTGVNYIANNIVAHPNGDGEAVYYKALSGNGPGSALVTPGTSESVWQTITDLSTVEDLIPADRKVTIHQILLSRGERGYAKEVSRAAKGSCCKACKSGTKAVQLDVLLQATYINCERLLYTKADLTARQLEDEVDSLECDNCRTAY